MEPIWGPHLISEPGPIVPSVLCVLSVSLFLIILFNLSFYTPDFNPPPSPPFDCFTSHTSSPSSVSTRVSPTPLVGCKYLHLTLSAAYWVFHSEVMLGPFLLALFVSLSNSVRTWGLPLSWIPIWACCWPSHPSLDALTIPSLTWCPVFLPEVGFTSSLAPL